MSLDAGLDALRRLGRKAVAKGKQLVTEVKKAAGLPAGGPVTESNPRYYIVFSDQGAMVRLTSDLDSAQVLGLHKGEMVTVVELLGRRGRISDPVEGWVSLESSTGESIFKQTFPPGKEKQVAAMERRFELMKQKHATEAPVQEPGTPTAPTTFNPAAGAVVNLKNRIKVRSEVSTDLLDPSPTSAAPEVVPRLAPPPS